MSFKGAVLLFVFVIVALVLWCTAWPEDMPLGETMIAAAMLGAFVIGVAAVAKLADARLKRK